MEQMKGCSLGQVLTITPGTRVWGKEDGECRGVCQDLGFMHPTEEHHSEPENAGGELLHSGMQKIIIHKIMLPAAVITPFVTPLVAPKPAPAQLGECPDSLQTIHQAGEDVSAK